MDVSLQKGEKMYVSLQKVEIMVDPFCRLDIFLQKYEKINVSLQKRWLKEQPLLLTEHFPPKNTKWWPLLQTGRFPLKNYKMVVTSVDWQLPSKKMIKLMFPPKKDWNSGTSADCPFPSKRWWHLSPFAICATVSCSQTLSNCICISLI